MRLLVDIVNRLIKLPDGRGLSSFEAFCALRLLAKAGELCDAAVAQLKSDGAKLEVNSRLHSILSSSMLGMVVPTLTAFFTMQLELRSRETDARPSHSGPEVSVESLLCNGSMLPALISKLDWIHSCFAASSSDASKEQHDEGDGDAPVAASPDTEDVVPTPSLGDMGVHGVFVKCGVPQTFESQHPFQPAGTCRHSVSISRAHALHVYFDPRCSDLSQHGVLSWNSTSAETPSISFNAFQQGAQHVDAVIKQHQSQQQQGSFFTHLNAISYSGSSEKGWPTEPLLIHGKSITFRWNPRPSISNLFANRGSFDVSKSRDPESTGLSDFVENFFEVGGKNGVEPSKVCCSGNWCPFLRLLSDLSLSSS
jgi:hypothetical protein